MKQRKTVIYILTALLAGAVALCAFLGGEAGETFSFLAGAEEIHFWEKEDGGAYVFLPSYVNLDDLKIKTPKPLHLDDLVFTDGMSCEDLELDRAYALPGGKTITFLRSENIPALFIRTASGNMEYVHKKKDNRESGSLRLYGADGALDTAADLESIKGRGNAYEYLSKKPYNLTLASEQDLLGMGAAGKWALLSNSMDPSHLKNKLVYDFAREAGLPYTPDCRWVELYLNGNYEGLYLLSERNEVHPQRVDLTEGGFLVSKEQLYNLAEENDPYFATDAGAYLRVRYNSLREGDMEEIFQRAENAILAPDGIDPATGKHWTELIDLNSWAGKYLVEEIFDGIDAGVASQFFFYREGKIWAGPVWDYDETMCAGIWLGDDMPWLDQIPEIFYAHRGAETPWFHSLYENETFYAHMTGLYRETFGPLLETCLREGIPHYLSQIRTAAGRNQLRWNCRDMEEAAGWIQQYMLARADFLREVWSGSQEYIEVHVDYTYDAFECKYALFDYALTPGQCLPELPDLEGYTWYVTGTNTPFDNSLPIYENMGVELRPD